MKLKKIASLALAGIMAVSMLTACGEGSNEIVNPNPNPAPTTSDVVSTIDEAMKDYNSNATINVKESDFLNARIDALVEKASYQELSKKDYKAIELAIESAFGKKDEMINLMKDEKPAALKCGTHWYYAIVDTGAVSGTTALNWAANEIADRMSDLEDEYIRDETMAGVVGGVVFEQNVAHTASYTMFVKQVNMTATGDTEVPITIAVLKVNVAEKV